MLFGEQGIFLYKRFAENCKDFKIYYSGEFKFKATFLRSTRLLYLLKHILNNQPLKKISFTKIIKFYIASNLFILHLNNFE